MKTAEERAGDFALILQAIKLEAKEQDWTYDYVILLLADLIFKLHQQKELNQELGKLTKEFIKSNEEFKDANEELETNAESDQLILHVLSEQVFNETPADSDALLEKIVTFTGNPTSKKLQQIIPLHRKNYNRANGKKGAAEQPKQKLKKWTIEQFNSKDNEWHSKNKLAKTAAVALMPEVIKYGKTIKAVLTDGRGEQTVAEWLGPLIKLRKKTR